MKPTVWVGIAWLLAGCGAWAQEAALPIAASGSERASIAVEFSEPCDPGSWIGQATGTGIVVLRYSFADAMTARQWLELRDLLRDPSLYALPNSVGPCGFHAPTSVTVLEPEEGGTTAAIRLEGATAPLPGPRKVAFTRSLLRGGCATYALRPWSGAWPPLAFLQFVGERTIGEGESRFVELRLAVPEELCSPDALESALASELLYEIYDPLNPGEPGVAMTAAQSIIPRVAVEPNPDGLGSIWVIEVGGVPAGRSVRLARPAVGAGCALLGAWPLRVGGARELPPAPSGPTVRRVVTPPPAAEQPVATVVSAVEAGGGKVNEADAAAPSIPSSESTIASPAADTSSAVGPASMAVATAETEESKAVVQFEVPERSEDGSMVTVGFSVSGLSGADDPAWPELTKDDKWADVWKVAVGDSDSISYEGAAAEVTAADKVSHTAKLILKPEDKSVPELRGELLVCREGDATVGGATVRLWPMIPVILKTPRKDGDASVTVGFSAPSLGKDDDATWKRLIETQTEGAGSLGDAFLLATGDGPTYGAPGTATVQSDSGEATRSGTIKLTTTDSAKLADVEARGLVKVADAAGPAGFVLRGWDRVPVVLSEPERDSYGKVSVAFSAPALADRSTEDAARLWKSLTEGLVSEAAECFAVAHGAGATGYAPPEGPSFSALSAAEHSGRLQLGLGSDATPPATLVKLLDALAVDGFELKQWEVDRIVVQLAVPECPAPGNGVYIRFSAPALASDAPGETAWRALVSSLKAGAKEAVHVRKSQDSSGKPSYGPADTLTVEASDATRSGTLRLRGGPEEGDPRLLATVCGPEAIPGFRLVQWASGPVGQPILVTFGTAVRASDTLVDIPFSTAQDVTDYDWDSLLRLVGDQGMLCFEIASTPADSQLGAFAKPVGAVVADAVPGLRQATLRLTGQAVPQVSTARRLARVSDPNGLPGFRLAGVPDATEVLITDVHLADGKVLATFQAVGPTAENEFAALVSDLNTMGHAWFQVATKADGALGFAAATKCEAEIGDLKSRQGSLRLHGCSADAGTRELVRVVTEGHEGYAFRLPPVPAPAPARLYPVAPLTAEADRLQTQQGVPRGRLCINLVVRKPELSPAEGTATDPTYEFLAKAESYRVLRACDGVAVPCDVRHGKPDVTTAAIDRSWLVRLPVWTDDTDGLLVELSGLPSNARIEMMPLWRPSGRESGGAPANAWERMGALLAMEEAASRALPKQADGSDPTRLHVVVIDESGYKTIASHAWVTCLLAAWLAEYPFPREDARLALDMLPGDLRAKPEAPTAAAQSVGGLLGRLYSEVGLEDVRAAIVGALAGAAAVARTDGSVADGAVVAEALQRLTEQLRDEGGGALEAILLEPRRGTAGAYCTDAWGGDLGSTPPGRWCRDYPTQDASALREWRGGLGVPKTPAEVRSSLAEAAVGAVARLSGKDEHGGALPAAVDAYLRNAPLIAAPDPREKSTWASVLRELMAHRIDVPKGASKAFEHEEGVAEATGTAQSSVDVKLTGLSGVTLPLGARRMHTSWGRLRSTEYSARLSTGFLGAIPISDGTSAASAKGSSGTEETANLGGAIASLRWKGGGWLGWRAGCAVALPQGTVEFAGNVDRSWAVADDGNLLVGASLSAQARLSGGAPTGRRADLWGDTVRLHFGPYVEWRKSFSGDRWGLCLRADLPYTLYSRLNAFHPSLTADVTHREKKGDHDAEQLWHLRIIWGETPPAWDCVRPSLWDGTPGKLRMEIGPEFRF